MVEQKKEALKKKLSDYSILQDITLKLLDGMTAGRVGKIFTNPQVSIDLMNERMIDREMITDDIFDLMGKDVEDWKKSEDIDILFKYISEIKSSK